MIPEDTNTNFSLGMILAYDEDLDQNGEIEFIILSGDPRFSINTVPVASSDDRQTFVGSLYSNEVRIHEQCLLKYNVSIVMMIVAI